MEKENLVSHAQIERVLRRAGYCEVLVEELLQELPDPLDMERYREELFKHGISLGALMDRRGASP